MIKLTQQEKLARGTAKTATVAPRSVRAIKQDIKIAKRALRVVRSEMKLAGESVDKDGIWLVTQVIGRDGEIANSKKPNPMIRIHSQCLASNQALERKLLLLAEELALAKEQKADDESFSEFA